MESRVGGWAFACRLTELLLAYAQLNHLSIFRPDHQFNLYQILGTFLGSSKRSYHELQPNTTRQHPLKILAFLFCSALRL